MPSRLEQAQMRILFGLRLRELRRDAGLSQEQLSWKVNRNRQYISMLERGDHSPTTDLLFDLAVGLNCSVHELLEPMTLFMEAKNNNKIKDPGAS